MIPTVPNPTIKFSVPYEGRHYLTIHKAKEISRVSYDTWCRKVYEIETTEGTEVWIEKESMLEAPEYFYNLFQYLGEETKVTL
jgi:hypothetical protein